MKDTDTEYELNNPVIKSMLQLLSAALNQSETLCDVDLSLWQDIKEELNCHAVLPLVSDLVMKSGIPEEDKIELAKATALNVRTFHKLMTAQTAVINLLNSNNIPAAVMKGASAAQYYTRPELRQYGDIDILVLPDDYRRTFELMRSSGYRNLQEYDAPYKRHIGFMTPEEKEVELHRYFSSSSNEAQNSLLDSWLYDSLQNVEHIKLNKFDVPVFPTLENGLILLGHINHHLCSGLGLRQIIDWMLYVRAELTDDFWRENFQSKAESIGMDYLAKTVTKMCQKYLGLGTEFTWSEDADDELVDELMLHIIKKGNFGEKIEQYSRKTIEIAVKLKSPKQFFSYLTEIGSTHMIEAGLKPRKAYAWLYQIGHLLHKTLSRTSKGNLSQEIQSGMRESDLLKRLKVTKI